MSDGYKDLATTVDTLMRRTGLDPRSLFDLKRLSFHTSLSEADIGRLLDGEEPEAAEVDHQEVARRIQFLMDTRLCREEGPGGVTWERQYTASEVAAGIGMTPQWLNTLLSQRRQSSPNLKHAGRIARFFDVPVNFLTDEPAEALNRVLRSEAIPESNASIGNPRPVVRNRYALEIQHRLGDVVLEPTVERALMLFVDGIAREKSPGGRASHNQGNDPSSHDAGTVSAGANYS
ncbi:helix-turn-helix transcriptional regulator [Streptomyces sp. NPDC046557]|uniref:helix-turn-helix domain-containing protein n=1 Tax=Streptomyces sp. NPDC046557 TaxID=3155372 RepID=UPI0033CF5B21